MAAKKEKTFADEWLDLHEWVNWLNEYGVPRPVFLVTIFIGLLGILSMEIPHFLVFSLGWIGGTAPIWLPIMLLVSSWNTWVRYIRSLYISGREPVLLEIKIPREITKSPRAIEIALNSLWSTSGETTPISRAWQGRVRPWYSLELASFGGDVHMYVWTWGAFRNIIEMALYAQYPDIEIHVVEDYAAKIQYDPARWDGFVNNYKLKKSGAYPIKSYIDFELDKDPKEEFKIDPLGQIFEYLSSLRPQEQVWLQIMLRANSKSHGSFSPTDTNKEWKAEVEKEIEDIRKKGLPEEDKEKGSSARFPNPTWRQRQQMEAIERHSGKTTFDVCVRGIYLVDKAKGGVHPPNIGNLRLIWKPFSADYLNDLGPDNSGGFNIFNFPWQDYQNIYRNSIMRRFLDAYRRRSCFYDPWRAPVNVMTVESIATLWHFPSSAVAAPGLNRIPATKAAPPSNLPM